MYHGRYKLLIPAGLLLTALVFIRFLLPILLPFLLGAGLALLAEPMTALLCRALRLPRGIASAVSVIVAFCFLTLILLLICASFIPVKPAETNGIICCTLMIVGIVYNFIRKRLL